MKVSILLLGLMALGCVKQFAHSAAESEFVVESSTSARPTIKTFVVDELTSLIFHVPVGSKAQVKTLPCPQYVFRDLHGTVFARVNGNVTLTLFDHLVTPPGPPPLPEPGGPTPPSPPLEPAPSICFASFACQQEAFGYHQAIFDLGNPISPPAKWPTLTGLVRINSTALARLPIEKTWAPCNQQNRHFSTMPVQIPDFLFNDARVNAAISANVVSWMKCGEVFPGPQATKNP